MESRRDFADLRRGRKHKHFRNTMSIQLIVLRHRITNECVR